MSSKPGDRRPISQWLPSDRKVTDKWLAGLMKELDTKYKKQLDLIMKRFPPAENEDLALKGHPHVTLPNIDISGLELHPPVEALMNAINTDPGKSHC